jgi:hypothetical protein
LTAWTRSALSSGASVGVGLSMGSSSKEAPQPRQVVGHDELSRREYSVPRAAVRLNAPLSRRCGQRAREGPRELPVLRLRASPRSTWASRYLGSVPWVPVSARLTSGRRLRYLSQLVQFWTPSADLDLVPWDPGGECASPPQGTWFLWVPTRPSSLGEPLGGRSKTSLALFESHP